MAFYAQGMNSGNATFHRNVPAGVFAAEDPFRAFRANTVGIRSGTGRNRIDLLRRQFFYILYIFSSFRIDNRKTREYPHYMDRAESPCRRNAMKVFSRVAYHYYYYFTLPVRQG